ncbi:MAG: zinc ribbon domain-containing protein, partial [Thaumarchaeota archaeon]|nr:zinc ribbon domain-containing protein [Nitrososphaerota archaeon]
MAFGGDVDTLSLTFDKLQYIFNGYDTILDSFLEINTLHKQGNITDYEFFNKIQDSVMRFSALEFLAIKSIFEIKKSLYRSIGIITTATDNT